MDDLNDLQFSPERQRSFFEAVARMQVPEDMKEEVRHFKPEGSMKRLQKVIELVFLDVGDEEDEGIPLEQLGSVNYGRYSKANRLKAAQIASTKLAEDSFSLEHFKDPLNKTYETIDDMKQEFDANDTTLEIPLVESESEKENYPKVHEVKNERNLEKPYAVVTLKKKEDITCKINVKCESRASQIGVRDIAPPKSTLELKCSRNAVRTQVTQMRDPFVSFKRNKTIQLFSVKPLP